MDRVDINESDLDLDIDLESGETTSGDEYARALNHENSKNLLSRIKTGFTNSESQCESTNVGDCSSLNDKLTISDDISAKNKEQLGKYREEMISYVQNTMVKEEKKAKKPSKPPRPPKGPSMDASDMKLLKEISALNVRRKRNERRRALRKIRKEKGSSLNSSNLFACLVTIVFFLVILFQACSGFTNLMPTCTSSPISQLC
ncbi:hypothetical protein CASFOL_017569 [Castilleja foliolosa]|uniref:Transmembrane protein n=1 Tax=Castilleja foliolosa TaxID=1961234 RepID=A0ABD3D7K6_9LAMI